MPGPSPANQFNQDFRDILSALFEESAEFLVVGGYAVGAHALPRATKDLDIWVNPSPENASRVLRALKRFGAPLFDLTLEDLAGDDTVFQIGLPPNRIDILTRISGVKFDDAWGRKLEVGIDGLCVPVLGRQDLITNKLTAGRRQDLIDVEVLEEQANELGNS